MYETIASHFSDTRHTKWPRVAEFLRNLPNFSLVADVGCGNGKYLQGDNCRLIKVCISDDRFRCILKFIAKTILERSWCWQIFSYVKLKHLRQVTGGFENKEIFFQMVCLSNVWIDLLIIRGCGLATLNPVSGHGFSETSVFHYHPHTR